MNYVVGFSEDAEQDLLELLDYLVPRGGDRVARRYVDRLIDYCLSFETFPQRGLLRDDVSPGLRLVGYHRKATIVFRLTGEAVTILRIYHGGRNVDLADFSDTVDPD